MMNKILKTYISPDYNDLDKIINKFSKNYLSASPFPHIVFKDFFNPDILNEVLNEFPDLSNNGNLYNKHINSDKYASRGTNIFNSPISNFFSFLNSEVFLKFLKKLSSMERSLIPDPYFLGGGLHEIKKDGFLNIHADFNKHKDLGLDRRLNLLIYLNKNWKEEYGGHFEMWDEKMEKCRKKILPEFNTFVLFSSTSYSYHGHPSPLNCPLDRSRKSLALYYYTNGRPKEEIIHGIENHSTLYQHKKNDKKLNVKKVLKEITPPVLIKLFRR